MRRAEYSLLGVLDLGSNSVRLVVYRVDEAGGFHAVENVKRTLRLGGRLDSDGNLGEAAVADLLDCIDQFRQIVEAWAVDDYFAVATAVFREAKNGQAVLTRVAMDLKRPVRLLTGEEEGRYGCLGVTETMPYGDALIADLGGASVEISSIRNGLVTNVVSLPIGAVTLTDRFETDHKSGQAALQATIQAALADHPWIAGTPGPLIAVGGTARSIGRIHQGRKISSMMGIHHHIVPGFDFSALAKLVADMAPSERAELPGLSQPRSELIVAGLSVFQALMGPMRPSFVVCGAGVREGLMFERLRASRGETSRATLAVQGAERLIAGCGGDVVHVRRVRHLAVAMLRSTNAALGLPPDPAAQTLLEVAALLRDLGRAIGLYGFETHTYHWILRAPLPGLTPAERARTALVASFRGGRMLRAAMQDLKQLVPPDAAQDLEKLGAILLVAEGLDRTRRGAVSNLSVDRENAGLVIRCVFAGEHPLETELLDDALHRYAKAFKRSVRVVATKEIAVV